MVCPNKTTEEWKELVEQYGEFKAISLFHLSGGDYEKIKNPDKLKIYSDQYEIEPELGSVLTKVSKERDKLIDAIRIQIKGLQSSFVTKKTADNKYIEEAISKLEESGKELIEGEFSEALEAFVLKAKGRLKNTREKATKIDPYSAGASNKIHLYRNNLAIYKVISSVSEALKDAQASGLKSIDEDLIDDTVNNIQGLINETNTIDKILDNKQKIAVSNYVSKITNVVRGERKGELEKEFQNNNNKIGSESNDDFYGRKKSWVQSKLNEESEELQNKEQERLLALTENAPYDISVVESWFNDPRTINDSYVQSVVTMMDQDDKKTDDEFLSSQSQISTVFKEWMKGKNKSVITNPLKLYKGFYEVDKDGKPTGFYNRPYYSDAVQAFRAYKRAFSSAKILDEDIYEISGVKEMGPDLKKRKELTKDFLEKYGKPGLSESFVGKKMASFDSSFIDDKWKNKDYDKIKNDKLFKALNELNHSADKALGKKGLGVTGGRGDSNGDIMRMPYIKRNFTQSLAIDGLAKKTGDAKSFLKNTIDRFKDLYQTAADDEQYGDVSNLKDGRVRVDTDAFGNPKKRIPILFRSTPDMDLQSFDLVGISLSNMYNSLNYKNKKSRIADVELIKDIVGKRKVTRTKGGVPIYHTVKEAFGLSDVEISEIESQKGGYDTNVYKTLESIINDRLYGEGSVAQVIGKVNLNKAAGTLSAITAHSMLSLNWLGSGLNNALQAEVSNFIMAGNRTFFTDKNLAKAHVKYTKMWPDVMKNMGSFHSEAKLDQLRHKFLPESLDFNGLQNNFLKNTKAKRLFGDLGGAQLFSKMGESVGQGTLVLAMLDNMKVTNQDGKYIDKEGKVVSKRKEAATIEEFYEFDKKDKIWKLPTALAINNGGTKINVEGFDIKNGKDLEFKIRRKIQEAAKRSQGNYGEKNKAMIQRYAGGKLGLLMRRWLIPSVQRRLKGFGYGKEKRNFNEAIGEFDEGSYIAAFHFMKNVVSQGGSLKERITSSWNGMTIHERGLTVEAVKEFALITSAAIAAVGLKALAESAGSEEEEKFWYTVLYLTKRTQADLSIYSYGLPGNFNRTLKDPSVALNTINSALGILSPFDIFDEYETGKSKGDNKKWHKLNMLLNPVYKHFYEDFDPKAKYGYIDKF